MIYEVYLKMIGCREQEYWVCKETFRARNPSSAAVRASQQEWAKNGQRIQILQRFEGTEQQEGDNIIREYALQHPVIEPPLEAIRV
jgi:hypothetical protein